MDNLEKLLKKIEKNYLEKDKRETVDFHLKGEVYTVYLLNRVEKAELLFSGYSKMDNLKDIYKWLKPVIYKSFQLKDLAIKAKENGYIKTYHEVIDYLFDPEDIERIVNFILRANRIKTFRQEELDFQKKQ